MRKALALVWVAIPPLLLSALVHSVDPDVGGVSGLTSPPTMLSVVVFGLPVIALALVCLVSAVRLGWGASGVMGVVLAAVAAIALTMLQSPSPEALAGYARPVLGGTALVWLFLAAAVVPAAALGRPAAFRRERHAV